MNDPVTAAYAIGFASGAVIATVITAVIFRHYIAESIKTLKAILAVPVTQDIDGSNPRLGGEPK